MKKEKILTNENYESTVLIDEERLRSRVVELGKQITSDFRDKTPVLVGVLTGSYMFMADLCREIELDCKIAFLQISSYDDEMESSGKVTLKSPLSTDIAGKDVILVEDIVDSGYSLQYLRAYFSDFKPASLAVVTLLNKPAAHKVTVNIDYVGFDIGNEFVIGYGLDFAGHKRNLKQIYTVKLLD